MELADREVLLEHLCYVAANPTAAGLVRRGRDYPGARTNPRDFIAPRVIGRPATRFFRDSRLPKSATLLLRVPGGFEELSPGRFAARFAARLGAVEKEHRRARRAAGRSFLGKGGIRKQRWRHPGRRAPQIPCHADSNLSVRRSGRRSAQRRHGAGVWRTRPVWSRDPSVGKRPCRFDLRPADHPARRQQTPDALRFTAR